jgi:plastocyanin
MSERGPREDVLMPLLLPLGALAAIGLILIGFSRILLRVTPTAATALALIAAASVLGVATFVASRRQIGNGSLFSMVGAVGGIAMLAGGVALFIAQPPGEEAAPVVAIAAPPGAATKGFATDHLTLPAGVPFQIAFDNQDSGQAHNVVISSADPTKDLGAGILFEGTIVTGPIQTTYDVRDPIQAGNYFFYCEVHPAVMHGTAEAVEGAGGEGGGGLVVVAKDLAFDTDTITLPADTETTLTFDNEDPGTQHNIAIYSDDTYTPPALFTGEIFAGPDTREYTIPPLPAGTYAFKCDVHPTMTGTVMVEKGPGGGPSPGGGAGAGGGQSPGAAGGGGPPSASATVGA